MVVMHRLFVYGTLRHPPLIEGLVGRAVSPTPATLAGHRAAPMRGRAYPGLVVDAGAETVGALVEVDDHGLAVLDHFEGDEYTRTAVTVTTADGRVDAEAYLLTGPTIALAGAGSWSFDEFVGGEADRWVHVAQPGTHHPTD